MSQLAPLLEVQELDLRADRLRKQRVELPERGALAQKEVEIAALDRAREAAEASRDELARAERELAREVASIASKAKEVETSLYSGTVTIAKELDSLNHELEIWKQKQEEAEERQLELMEQIESADADLAQQGALHGAAEAAGGGLSAAIEAAEAAIDREVAGLEDEAGGMRGGLPAQMLAAYDRLRANERLAGRAAVPLGKGMCEGCQLDLPVMEYRRLREEPEDAVVFCVHCSRLLIR